MVSTLHTAQTAEASRKRAGTSKVKPKCVIDYNIYTYDVDSADQYLSYYPIIQ
jgi:hypothetical protein